jgi:hypothetical protein
MALLASVLVILAGASRAQLLHRVGPGDTVRALSLRFYEDARFAELISAHNGLRAEPKPGTELRIPSASRHEVRRGESWSDLAARYWSDAGLGSALAQWCGAERDSAPQPGQRLTIPALVNYRLRPGETLAALSRRFYGGPQRAESLARLNRTRNANRLRAGHLLRIPLLAAAQGVEENEPVARRDVAAAPSEARDPAPAADLQNAVNAYLDGSFEQALEKLEQLELRIRRSGSVAEQRMVLRYLVFSYVAFDRDDAACDAFARLRKVEPDPDLDPELVSPKIRGVINRCP